MTELAQEVEATPEVIFGHEIRSTTCGDVIFINTNFVTPKTIDILVESINQMDDLVSGHGMYTVVFRMDGRPRVKSNELNTWIFNPDAKSAICNVSDCIELAFTNTMDEDKTDAVYCNVAHIAWKHLITGFFHEAHHANAFITDYDELIGESDDARQIEELRADEFADLHSFHMAKLVNMEPEFSEHVMGMLNEQWLEYSTLINEDEKADDHSKLWLKVQTQMMQAGSSFFMPADEDSGADHFECKTFKEFMKWTSQDSDDEAWDAEPVGVVQTGLHIPDPNVTAENTPAAIANTNPVMPNAVSAQYMEPDDLDMEGHDDAQPYVAPTVMGAINQEYAQQPAAPAQNGFQGVQQQFVPAVPAPVAAATPVHQQTAAVPAADAVAFQATVKSLYLKMFHHIFQTCGYNPQMPQVFGQKDKIVDMLPLTPEEANIVGAMDCYNELGQVAAGTPCQNWLSGVFIDKAQQLPGYTLTLNTLEGAQIFRKFVPQNPNKVNFETKQPTKPALDAKAGNQILWVIDPSDPKGATRVYNGVYQRQEGYNWIAI